jgi:hypothetical protein
MLGTANLLLSPRRTSWIDAKLKAESQGFLPDGQLFIPVRRYYVIQK